MSGCPANYAHFAHGDCPGVGPSPEEYAQQDFDDIAYLEFYHEVYLFGDEYYRIEKGESGIVEIRGDTNLITHEDGRTEPIPWSCVQTWTHVDTTGSVV